MQPDDVGNIVVGIPYKNADEVEYVLTLTLRLQSAVNNSLPAESAAGIKERAPQSFYAQDRMVSAQDYQVLPLSKSTNISTRKSAASTTTCLDQLRLSTASSFFARDLPRN